MPTTDLILPAELAELDATAAAIPRTQLVHLLVAGVGLVITREQAKRLARELLNATGHRGGRGHADAAGGRAAPARSAAR